MTAESPRTDEDLLDIDRVLAGDAEAFAGIVRRWQGPLVNLAYRFCRDRGEAEEMAQEVFLKVYRNLASWRRDARFSTWMFAVATNHCRSRMRRSRPRLVALEDVARPPEAAGADLVVTRADEADWIRRQVGNLPARYRDVLALFYFHEMDVDETAASLGIPSGTVKARLHRGRNLLRRRIEGMRSRTTLPEIEAVAEARS